MGKACTVWDVLAAAAKYDGSDTAHKDVINCLKKHGHKVATSDGWCTETVMAIFYDAGGIDLVGGYHSESGSLKASAEKLGVYHKGSFGILPGDIVIYGSNGKSNHVELAVGATDNISGNYVQVSPDTCARRKRARSTLMGYIRPKYAACPEMNNLQTMIAACDVMLGVYGSGESRVKMLDVFGSKNREAIQAEVTRVWGQMDKVVFDFAVYVIQGRAGKGSYRKTRLGTFFNPAQDKVNAIYALRNRGQEQTVQDVISGRYHTNAVREFLLTWNGYNAADIQALVNEKYQKTQTKSNGRFMIYPIWFFEKDESAYGDCTAIIQYDSDGNVAYCVLIDCGMDKTANLVISKLKGLGVSVVHAIIISHGHGDHYGGSTKIIKAFNVQTVYIPNCDGLDKYQKTYANALRRQAAKVSDSHVMEVGKSFAIGDIKWKVLWQVDASKLTEHDSHHLVNNLSPALRFDLGGVLYHTAGDMQNPANNPMVKAVSNLHAHVFKTQWHGDGNATNDRLCNAIKPVIAISDFQIGRASCRERV